MEKKLKILRILKILKINNISKYQSFVRFCMNGLFVVPPQILSVTLGPTALGCVTYVTDISE